MDRLTDNVIIKGHLISKCLFGVFKSTKITNQIFVRISVLASKRRSNQKSILFWLSYTTLIWPLFRGQGRNPYKMSFILLSIQRQKKDISKLTFRWQTNTVAILLQVGDFNILYPWILLESTVWIQQLQYLVMFSGWHSKNSDSVFCYNFTSIFEMYT